MGNLSRETSYRLQNFLVSSRKLVRAKTRAPAVIRKEKSTIQKKSLDLFEGIYDKTGCARPKDRRRKSEKQISIMRTSFSTIKAKLEEVIEVELDLNFKSSRLTITIFQFAKPPETASGRSSLYYLKKLSIHYRIQERGLKNFCHLIFTVNNSRLSTTRNRNRISREYLERLERMNVESFRRIRKHVRSIEIARPTNLRVTEGRKT